MSYAANLCDVWGFVGQWRYGRRAWAAREFLKSILGFNDERSALEGSEGSGIVANSRYRKQLLQSLASKIVEELAVFLTCRAEVGQFFNTY